MVKCHVVDVHMTPLSESQHTYQQNIEHIPNSHDYLQRDFSRDLKNKVKEICPRGNNKVVIYISLYHAKCLLFMLELY